MKRILLSIIICLLSTVSFGDDYTELCLNHKKTMSERLNNKLYSYTGYELNFVVAMSNFCTCLELGADNKRKSVEGEALYYLGKIKENEKALSELKKNSLGNTEIK